jgi:hypothetical protein
VVALAEVAVRQRGGRSPPAAIRLSGDDGDKLKWRVSKRVSEVSVWFSSGSSRARRGGTGGHGRHAVAGL